MVYKNIRAGLLGLATAYATLTGCAVFKKTERLQPTTVEARVVEDIDGDKLKDLLVTAQNGGKKEYVVLLGHKGKDANGAEFTYFFSPKAIYGRELDTVKDEFERLKGETIQEAKGLNSSDRRIINIREPELSNNLYNYTITLSDGSSTKTLTPLSARYFVQTPGIMITAEDSEGTQKDILLVEESAGNYTTLAEKLDGYVNEAKFFVDVRKVNVESYVRKLMELDEAERKAKEEEKKEPTKNPAKDILSK